MSQLNFLIYRLFLYFLQDSVLFLVSTISTTSCSVLLKQQKGIAGRAVITARKFSVLHIAEKSFSINCDVNVLFHLSYNTAYFGIHGLRHLQLCGNSLLTD